MNKKLTVIVEWTGDNFGASVPDIIGCVATGKTPGEVKQAYASALEFHRQGADEGELPEWIMRGEYVLDFELTAGALLKYYGDVVTLSAMSRATGINTRQLSHYINGNRTPRARQRERIVAGLHTIAKQLADARWHGDGGRGVLYTPLKTPRKGRMIKRPGTCGAHAIRPYPTGRRGRAQKQKRMD